MNKAVMVLRISAIIINVLLCVIMTLGLVVAEPSGKNLILLASIVIVAVLNILILSGVRTLIAGKCGTVLICLATVLNVCSLLGVLAGLYQYGMPGDVLSNMAVFVWLIFPLVTLPALFMVRSQMRKGVKPCPITCPNCGTEFQR